MASAQDASGAEALYRDGKRLVAEGKIREGCLKLGESQRAEPTLGTLMALAACHEKEGKIGSAWSEFSQAYRIARTQGDIERADYAREHAEALAPDVHYVVLGLIAPPQDIKIVVGEKTYGAAVSGTPLPVDPGDYEIRATAAGKKPWTKTISIPKRSGQLDVVIQMQDAPVEETKPGVRILVDEKQPSRRTISLIVGGAGVLAAGLGTGLLLYASSQGDNAFEQAEQANVQNNFGAYQAAERTHERAALTQIVGVGALGLGAAGIGIGTYLFLTAKTSKEHADRKAASLAPLLGTTLGIHGTFQ